MHGRPCRRSPFALPVPEPRARGRQWRPPHPTLPGRAQSRARCRASRRSRQPPGRKGSDHRAARRKARGIGGSQLYPLRAPGLKPRPTSQAGVPASTTTLKRAPPLAKLLTRAIDVGISIASRARRRPDAVGAGTLKPAIGGTLPIAPQRSAAAHAALPPQPLSPIAPLIDVTTGPPPRREPEPSPPKTSISACASTSSSEVALAEA